MVVLAAATWAVVVVVMEVEVGVCVSVRRRESQRGVTQPLPSRVEMLEGRYVKDREEA